MTFTDQPPRSTSWLRSKKLSTLKGLWTDTLQRLIHRLLLYNDISRVLCVNASIEDRLRACLRASELERRRHGSTAVVGCEYRVNGTSSRLIKSLQQSSITVAYTAARHTVTAWLTRNKHWPLSQ